MELAVRNWKQGQEPGNREEEAFYKTIEKNLVIIGKETKNLVCTKYIQKEMDSQSGNQQCVCCWNQHCSISLIRKRQNAGVG